MGIKGFSDLIESDGVITWKELKDKKIAIDVYNYLYRIALGSKAVNNLTSEDGKNTTHINVILANLVKFKQYNIGTIWVFDAKSAPDIKKLTLEKRRENKEKAIKALAEISKDESMTEANKESSKMSEISKDENTESITENTAEGEQKEDAKTPESWDIVSQAETPKSQEVQLFSGELTQYFEEPQAEEIKVAKKNRLEKQAFKLPQYYVDDLLFLLDGLHLQYTIAPDGFEGEQIAAILTDSGHSDYVLSSDFDVLIFKGTAMLKKVPKQEGKFELYTYKSVMNQIKKKIPGADHDTLIKIAIALGNDYNERIRGYGAKKVITNFHRIDFTPYKHSEEMFKKTTDSIEIANLDATPFADVDFTKLKDWLSNNSFSDGTITRWITNMQF